MLHLFGEAPADREASWQPPADVRGSFNILSSCVLTLGLCIWSAVHLNVPKQQVGPNRSKWDPRSWLKAKHLHKVGWLILGLLAPEMIAFTAWVQRRDAHRLTGQMNDEVNKNEGSQSAPHSQSEDIELVSRAGDPVPRTRSSRRNQWTHVHSFFALQGGIAVDTSALPENEKYLPGKRERVILGPGAIRALKGWRPDLLPDISENNIKDKSKADAFAKGIVCVQAAWFMIQCIYRLATPGLSIALLELNTFAHCVCTFLIYGFWWDKPMDIDEPIVITHPDIHDFCASSCDSVTFDRKRDNEQVSYLEQQLLMELGQNFQPNADLRLAEAFNIVLRELSAFERTHDVLRQEDLTLGERIPGTFVKSEPGFKGCTPRDRERWNRACLFARSDLTPTQYQFYIVSRPRVYDRQGNLPVGSDFGNFLDPLSFGYREEGSQGLYFSIGLTLTGTVYGGLHLLGWNAPFTSHTQEYLWRISAVAVAACGPAVFVVGLIGLCSDYVESKLSSSLRSWVENVLVFPGILSIFILGSLLYFFARVYLVVECFISLAYLPDSAFKQPAWNGYFPHIQ